MKINFTLWARLDVFEISDWYAFEHEGLDEQFEAQLELTFARILEAPLAHKRISGRYRRIKTRIFPYYIYFVVLKDELRIIAVVHTSRNPHWIRKMLRKRN